MLVGIVVVCVCRIIILIRFRVLPLLYNWYYVNLERHSRLFTTHALYNLFMPLMLHNKFTFFYHVEYISGKTARHDLINM